MGLFICIWLKCERESEKKKVGFLLAIVGGHGFCL